MIKQLFAFCMAIWMSVFSILPVYADSENAKSKSDSDTVVAHTVTFHHNNGITADRTVKVLTGNTVEEPEKPESGLDTHIFSHWRIRNGNSYEIYDFSKPVNHDLKLYAKHKPREEYKVTFHHDNGELDKTVTVLEGRLLEEPQKPKSAFPQYRFHFWSDQKDGGSPYDFSQPVYKNFDLYARHEKNTSYKVTFDHADGKTPSKVENIWGGEKVAEPSKPTREGFIFNGWFVGENKYNFDAEVESDLTLTAKWDKESTAEAQPPATTPNNSSSVSGGSAQSGIRPTGNEATISDNPVPLAASDKQRIAEFIIGSKEFKLREDEKMVTKITDLAPSIHKGRTMLPIRIVNTILGLSSEYDNATKTATFRFTDKENKVHTIEMTIGKKTMTVDGVTEELSAEPIVSKGRMILPITDLKKSLQAMGLDVDIVWLPAEKAVHIYR
ncbi:MAG: InlB B-repeat-containing protein [Peptostreptococcaceae bacterium]|nr:InlB B-repeat-containing protein [Peptostreptococcaceae bacterium]